MDVHLHKTNDNNNNRVFCLPTARSLPLSSATTWGNCSRRTLCLDSVSATATATQSLCHLCAARHRNLRTPSPPSANRPSVYPSIHPSSAFYRSIHHSYRGIHSIHHTSKRTSDVAVNYGKILTYKWAEQLFVSLMMGSAFSMVLCNAWLATKFIEQLCQRRGAEGWMKRKNANGVGRINTHNNNNRKKKEKKRKLVYYIFSLDLRKQVQVEEAWRCDIPCKIWVLNKLAVRFCNL